MAGKFGSAAAFKNSLEAHLRKRAEERKVPLSTLQLKFVMERLLARLFRNPNPPWLLKGGFAMDLRFRPRARTTKDVDLSITLVPLADSAGLAAAVRERLQEAADQDMGDYLNYRIGAPKQELTNAPKGGTRYPCEAVLVGKVYARFHIDVGCGDALVGEPEQLVGDDLLSFAGVAPASVLAIPKAQQFAEKLHAYTFPWVKRTNTRTKDMVDLVLLIERGPPEADDARRTLEATFSTRATHPLPMALPPPPAEWRIEFTGMAAEAGLSTKDYLEAFAILERFWTSHRLGDVIILAGDGSILLHITQAGWIPPRVAALQQQPQPRTATSSRRVLLPPPHQCGNQPAPETDLDKFFAALVGGLRQRAGADAAPAPVGATREAHGPLQRLAVRVVFRSTKAARWTDGDSGRRMAGIQDDSGFTVKSSWGPACSF